MSQRRVSGNLRVSNVYMCLLSLSVLYVLEICKQSVCRSEPQTLKVLHSLSTCFSVRNQRTNLYSKHYTLYFLLMNFIDTRKANVRSGNSATTRISFIRQRLVTFELEKSWILPNMYFYIIDDNNSWLRGFSVREKSLKIFKWSHSV